MLKFLSSSSLNAIIIGKTFSYVFSASEGNYSPIKSSIRNINSWSAVDSVILVQNRVAIKMSFYPVAVTKLSGDVYS